MEATKIAPKIVRFWKHDDDLLWHIMFSRINWTEGYPHQPMIWNNINTSYKNQSH